MYLWDFKANYVETVESRVADTALALHTSSSKTPMFISGLFLPPGIEFLIFISKPVMETGHCPPDGADDSEEEEEEEEEVDDMDHSSSSPPTLSPHPAPPPSLLLCLD